MTQNQSQEEVPGGRNVPSEILLEILSYPLLYPLLSCSKSIPIESNFDCCCCCWWLLMAAAAAAATAAVAGAAHSKARNQQSDTLFETQPKQQNTT